MNEPRFVAPQLNGDLMPGSSNAHVARIPEPADEAALEHVVALLRERLYGAISCLATLAVLSRHAYADTDAWELVLDVALASGGLWAASLLADWVSHLAVHGKGPRGKDALDVLRASGQILAAATAPVLVLVAAGLGWLGTDVALDIAQWLLVAGLCVIALLALRRTKLAWWQRFLTIGVLAGLGVIVIAIKTWAH
jgi:hypothetical protein